MCDYSLSEMEPRLFSFNNRWRLPVLRCLGEITFFDPKRIVAYPGLSLAGGAIKGWIDATSLFPDADRPGRAL